MTVLMEQHQRWSAARERLWKPVRRDLRKLVAAIPAAIPVPVDEDWGVPSTCSPNRPRAS